MSTPVLVTNPEGDIEIKDGRVVVFEVDVFSEEDGHLRFHVRLELRDVDGRFCSTYTSCGPCEVAGSYYDANITRASAGLPDNGLRHRVIQLFELASPTPDKVWELFPRHTVSVCSIYAPPL